MAGLARCADHPCAGDPFAKQRKLPREGEKRLKFPPRQTNILLAYGLQSYLVNRDAKPG